MLNQQTISILHSLKLFGMAKGLEERSANTQHAELSHAEFVGLLVQDEKTYLLGGTQNRPGKGT